jgi:hypothetical protein
MSQGKWELGCLNRVCNLETGVMGLNLVKSENLCGLMNDAISSAARIYRTINNELERTGKEADVACFKVLS